MSDSVKIYFCDICNESIPLKDLEMGAAITIKGKVICHRCNPQTAAQKSAAAVSSSGMPAAAPVYATHSNFGMAGVVAVIALLVGGAAIGLFILDRETNHRNFQAANEAVRSVEQRIDKIDKSISDLKGQIAIEIDRADRKLNADFRNEIDKERSSGENRFALLKEKVDLLQESLRQAEGLRTRLEQNEAWRVAAEQKLSAVKADLESMLQELRSVKEAAAKAAVAAPPVTAAAPGTPPGATPIAGWDEIIKKLKDPDPGVRWNAVIDLGQTGDPRAIPHLVPLLKDEDVFVRNNTALTLGELDAKSAVGDLIEALGDSEQVVRDSAYTVLKRITKQTIKFDPFSSRKEDREKGINNWRDWWNSNKSKFTAS